MATRATWFDRILGSAGFLISLPGFLLLFFSGYGVAAALTALLGLAILVGVAYHARLQRLPSYTIRHAKVTLEFLDDSCRRARLTKTYQIRANHNRLTQIRFRNIGSDGELHDVRWNGQPVEDHGIKKLAHTWVITIDLGRQLRRNEELTGELSYRADDSFAEAQEYLIYEVDFQTEKAELMVLLPQSRSAKSTWASHVAAGDEDTLDDPVLTNDGKQIAYKIKRPVLATEYHIWWSW